MYNKLKIPARERPSWECIDLGFASAKEHYLILFLLFLAPALCIAVTAFFIFPEYQTWLPMVIVWWLKPLFERPILFFLSRTLFGEPMSIRKVLNNYFSLLKPGLLARLSFSRLSPSRSFLMPINLLEKQAGTAYRQRRDLLSFNQSAHGWLTILGVHIEYVLLFTAFFFIYMFIPESVFIGNVFDFIDNDHGNIIYHFLAVLVMAGFAPFYISAGFMLYLNRRIKLEGWDIEINFHNIVNRLHKKREVSKAKQPTILNVLSTSLIIAIVAMPSLSGSYHANETNIISGTDTKNEIIFVSKDEAYEKIYELYQSEEVVTKIKKTGWRPIYSPEEPEEETWFNVGFFEGLSKVLRFIAIVVIVSILIYLIYFYRDIFKYFRKEKQIQFDHQSELTPIAKRLQNLPDDFLAASTSAWEKGQYRSAMSLLYRGSLSRLVKKGCTDILAASTEQECLYRIQGFKNSQYYPDLRLITKEWQQTAYAQRLTSNKTFYQLVEIVRNNLLDNDSATNSLDAGMPA